MSTGLQFHYYSAVRIKNYVFKKPSVFKVTSMKNTDNFHYVKEAIMCQHHFSVSKDKLMHYW